MEFDVREQPGSKYLVARATAEYLIATMRRESS